MLPLRPPTALLRRALVPLRARAALPRRVPATSVPPSLWNVREPSRSISITRPLFQQQRDPRRWLAALDDDTLSTVLIVLLFGCPSVYFLLSRKSPLVVFNESVDLLSAHHEVTSRLGEPVYAYGEDYGVPVRRHSFKRHKYTDADGRVHNRLKYNIEGPKGHATVYVETIEGAPSHDYVYLIVQFTDLNEVVKIVDNRKDDATSPVTSDERHLDQSTSV